MAPPAQLKFHFAPKTLTLEWEPVLGIDVRKLLEKAPSVEQLEVLESTSKSLLPTAIQKDNGKDCLDRMVHLAKVLQLGLEYQSEVSDQKAARLELELDGLQQDLRRAHTGDSDATTSKMEREIEDLNSDLRAAYVKMDSYEAELDDLREEVAQRTTEGRGRTGPESNVLRREMEEERAKSIRLERQVEFLEGQLDHERQRYERNEAEMREEKRSAAMLREKAKQLDDEVGELRTQLEAEQKRMEMREMDDRGQSSRLQQKNREIDRLLRENKLLERQFLDVQAKSEELASEMLQLSEQVVKLDEAQKEKDATIADMEALAADAEREKDDLMRQVKELQSVASEKMALLDEFEKRFAEQYREWEARVAELSEEVKAREDEANALREELERGSRDAFAAAGEVAQHTGDGEGESMLQQLRAAQEKEALLLEAYEQLERDQEKELAAALARQRSQLTRLETQNLAKQAALEADRQRYVQLDKALADAQVEKEEALSRLADYEAGVYGLSEAMRDVKRLKKAVKSGEEELQACLGKLNHRNQQLEDLLEENRFLREKAGISERSAIDLGDFKLQGQVEVEQLRALNAQLERELAQLEEERRGLKNELRYRAKYHGEAAAKMGLTAKQLVALEEYSNKLRFGEDEEADERAYAREPRRVENADRALRTKLSLADAQNGELRETMEHVKEENALLMRENLVLKERVIMALSKATRHRDKNTEIEHVPLKEELADALQTLRTEVTWQASQLAAPENANSNVPAIGHVPSGEYERALRERVSRLMDEVSEKEVEADEARARAERAERERNAFRARLQEQVDSQKVLTSAATSPAPRSVANSPLGDHKAEQRGEEVAGILRAQLEDAIREAQIKEDQLALLTVDAEDLRAQIEKLKQENLALTKEEKRKEEAHASALVRAERGLEEARVQLSEARSEAAEWEKAAASLRGDVEGDARQQLVSNVKRLIVLQVKLTRASRAAELAAAEEIEARGSLKKMQQEMEEMEDTLRQYHWFLEKSKEEADARAASAQKELAACVPRIDHLVIVNQLQETQKKLTEHVTDKTELTRARAEADRMAEELAQLRSEAEKVEEERATLADKCAQLEVLLRDPSGDEARMREELVALRVGCAHARARAEMAAQEKAMAQSLQEGAEKRARELEGQIASLAKQLHEAHEDARALRESSAKSPLKAAESILRSKATGLEGEVRRWKQSAEALQSKLEQREGADAAAALERDHLRVAVRELGQATDGKAEAAKMHEKMARARSKEVALVRQLTRAETSAKSARAEVLQLRQQMDEQTARLFQSQKEARAVQMEQERAVRRLESALACQIDGSKAATWSAELLRLAAEKKALSAAAASLKEEVSAFQDALDFARGELARKEAAAAAASATAPEVYRQNIALGERELQLKLGVAKLERQIAVEKERNAQLEKRNAESEERIAELEESALREQARLEEARDSWKQKAGRCESELLSVKKERDALDVQLRMERSVHKAAAPPAAEVLIHGEEAAHLRRQIQDQAEAARAQSKEHFQEVTRLTHESEETARRLRNAGALARARGDELQAVRQERDALLARMRERVTSAGTSAREDREGRAAEQVAAVAQATIARLQSLLGDKEAAINTLREALSESRRKMLEQQAKDRQEIGRLNEALFLRNEKSIQDMRTALHDVGKRLPAGGAAGGRFAELTFEELKRTATEKEEQIQALEQRLREWESRYKDMEARLTRERDARTSECAKLQQDVQVERARAPSKLMESLVAKLKTQLGAKESKLQHMKDAIKQLESRLIAAMQANAEAVLERSARGEPTREQGAADARERLRELSEKMERMKEEVLRCRQIEQDRTAECQALKEEIFKEKEAGRRLTNELQRSKSLGGEVAVQSSDTQARNFSDNQPSEVVQLKEKLRILAVQNKRLQKQVAEINAGESNDGIKQRPGSARESRPSVSKVETSAESFGKPRAKRASSDAWPAAAEGTRKGLGGFDTKGGKSSPAEVGVKESPDKENAAVTSGGTSTNKELDQTEDNPKAALISWQEQKKAARRLESLRAKLAQSKKELEAAEGKLQVADVRIAQLEREVDKYKEKVRALEAARRDYESNGPKLGDAPKLRGLSEAFEELERENHSLRFDLLVKKERELAELRRMLDGLKSDSATSARNEPTANAVAKAGIGRGGSPRFGRQDEPKTATLQELQECKRAHARAEDALLARDNVNLELRFEKEQSVLQLARVQRRLKLLFDEELGVAESPVGTPRGGVQTRGKTTPRKEQELEGVIEALKKVAEKLRSENEALRRASHSNVKYMEMLNKNRDYRKRVLKLEAELESAKRNGSEELLKKTTRLEDSQGGLRTELRKAKDEVQRLKLELEGERAAREELEADQAAARALRSAAEPTVPEAQYADLSRRCRGYEEEIGRLRSELCARAAAAEELARRLEDAEDELDLLHGQQTVRNAVGLEQLAAEVRKLRGHVSDLEAERDELLQGRNDGTPERDVSTQGADARRLTEENQRLRAELASYGPAFFQEVEELKADHHELTKLCDHYEALLHDQAQRTGRPFTPGIVS